MRELDLTTPAHLIDKVKDVFFTLLEKAYTKSFNKMLAKDNGKLFGKDWDIVIQMFHNAYQDKNWHYCSNCMPIAEQECWIAVFYPKASEHKGIRRAIYNFPNDGEYSSGWYDYENGLYYDNNEVVPYAWKEIEPIVPPNFKTGDSYVLVRNNEGIMCSKCGVTSFNEEHVSSRYCPKCKRYHL